MNKVYLYDGKYLSLLNLIITLIDNKIIPSNIKSEYDYQDNLLEEPVYFKLDEGKDKIKRINRKVFNICYYAFLCNASNREYTIYEFIKYSFLYKEEVIYHRELECVNDISKLSHKVSMESHHMKGFLRFKKMKHFYYAEMEPTNNIIWTITRHFKERLKNECWIIKDAKRDIYALYDTKKVIYLKNSDIVKLNLDLSNEEELFEDLWKTFFKTVAIKERENKKCQMNFMPKKYWSHMIEMEDEL